MEMETEFRENQSSIAEIMNLLTPGRTYNNPVDVTLVLASPAGRSGN